MSDVNTFLFNFLRVKSSTDQLPSSSARLFRINKCFSADISSSSTQNKLINPQLAHENINQMARLFSGYFPRCPLFLTKSRSTHGDNGAKYLVLARKLALEGTRSIQLFNMQNTQSILNNMKEEQSQTMSKWSRRKGCDLMDDHIMRTTFDL